MIASLKATIEALSRLRCELLQELSAAEGREAALRQQVTALEAALARVRRELAVSERATRDAQAAKVAQERAFRGVEQALESQIELLLEEVGRLRGVIADKVEQLKDMEDRVMRAEGLRKLAEEAERGAMEEAAERGARLQEVCLQVAQFDPSLE